MYRKLILVIYFLLALGAVSNAPALGQLSDPYPPDGATGVPLNVTLRWEISEEFDWLEVYLGTNYDDVYNARDWSPEYESYLDAWEDYYEPYGLEPGTTYYWKIIGYQEGELIFVYESSVWEFTTGLAKATNPYPANGATDVDPNVVLSWTPGCMADVHDVYLGTNFDEVANADTTTTGIYRGRQDANDYNPGTLEPGTDYYWRTDEVNNLDPDSPWKGNVWCFTTVPYIKVRDLKEPTQKVELRVDPTYLELVWNGDQGEKGGGRGEVYIATGIYWPVVVQDPDNPQLRMFGPLGGDSGFPSGRIYEYPDPPKYRVTPAVVKDGKFRTIYRNKADCPVPDYFALDVSVWENDSWNDLADYIRMLVEAAFALGGQPVPRGRVAGEIIAKLIAMLSSGDDALGRATNEKVTIGPKEEIDKLCSCERDDRIEYYAEVPLENLAKQLWKDCSAEDDKGFNFEHYNIEPPEYIGALGLKITLDKIMNAKSSQDSKDATTSKEISCVDLGQPDESIITGVLSLGAPLLSDSTSRRYSMFLDVDNNLATGSQGYPYDGAEFEMVAEFDNSENPTYKLMQYSSNTGTFEEVPGGLYDGAVNIDGRAIFLQVELSSLGDPSGPIAGWGVVHDQGVVVDVLPEHPEQLALGITPTYTYTGLPPIVVTTDPPHDAIDVDRETSIEVVFSKSMARPEAETAFSMNPPVDGSFAWQGNTLIFIPSGPLEPMTRYEVTIAATATDRVGTLFDGNGDLTTGDSFTWEFITVGCPLSCCDVDGVRWDVFCEGEPIYVTGMDFDPSSEVEIYIVRHARAELIPGAELIDVTDTGSNLASINAEGVLPVTLVGSITDEGEYNIIVDVNSNGLFDPGIDRCDKTGIGFAVLSGSRLVGDLNDDGVVDYLDIEILTKEWLDGNDVQSDLSEDSKVDFKDYATLANAWHEDRLWPCEMCVQEISNVKFHQVNWYDANGTLAQENTLWGRMSFSYYPGDTTSYLNVTLANSLGGAEAWVVQNLPLFAVDNDDYYRRSEAVDINLEDLGMVAGEDWSEVYWKSSIDSSIRTEAVTDPNIYREVEVLDQLSCGPIEVSPDPGPLTHAIAPEGVKIDNKPVKESKTRDVKGIQEGLNKCFAGSFARSVEWLNRAYDLGMANDPNAQEIYKDLIEKGVSDKSVGNNVHEITTEWIKAKNEYARQKTGNKIVTKVWDPGDLGFEGFPNGMVDPINGVNETNGDFVTWLKNELKHGEDVELQFFFAGGAHVVTVLENYTEDSDTYVKYRDDEKQGIPNEGDKVVKHAKIYKKDGKYHFGSDQNYLQFAVSESPDKNQNGIGDGFE